MINRDSSGILLVFEERCRTCSKQAERLYRRVNNQMNRSFDLFSGSVFHRRFLAAAMALVLMSGAAGVLQPSIGASKGKTGKKQAVKAPVKAAAPLPANDPGAMSLALTPEASAAGGNQSPEPVASEFSISVSGDIKKDLQDGEFSLVKPFGRTAGKLTELQSQTGIPDSVLLMEPTEADNPIQESMMSKIQTISRFKRGSKRDEITERRSYVDKVRANRVYFDKGIDTLGRKKKYLVYDERTGRPIGTVEIISGNRNTSSANMTEGSLNSVYEGCYIRY